MDAEQTWPDEYDAKDDGKLRNAPGTRNVPKGTSSYQAAWILEEDEGGEGSEEDSEEDEDEEEAGVEGEMEVEADENTDAEDHDIEGKMDDLASELADDGEDEADDLDEVEKYRREREDAQFPDEIDTPIGDLARIRFQKFRGLKSFRTSPWDPKENLPSDYARIFQFQNYKKTRKNVLSQIDEYDSASCVFPGQYVTLQIDRVPI
ncbi:unnamed protein product, partial [Strongylus vulgaris]